MRITDIDSRPTPPNPPEEQTDRVEAWLAIFSRLLHLPGAVNDEICAELREHLVQRRRDLLLEGFTEHEAVVRAIDELGEVTEIARRFKQADRPKQRRAMMNIAMIGLGAGAVVLGTSMIPASEEGSTPVAFYQPGERVSAEPPASLEDLQIELRGTELVESWFQYIGESVDLQMVVHWNSLSDIGLDREDEMTINFRGTPVRTLQFIRDRSAQWESDRLEWRFSEDILELASTSFFDRRERVLAIYDLRGILDQSEHARGRGIDVSGDAIAEVIHQFVEPELWMANGGERASLNIIGGRMCVEAPPRLHARVKWILSQFSEEQEARAAAPWGHGAPGDGAGALKPGDALRIEVYELFAANQWFQATRLIEADGHIRVPEVGRFAAAGKTPAQVEAAVREKVHVLMANPIVSVYQPVSSVQHRVKAGDSLGAIARQYYGDLELWKMISDANPGMDPHQLRVGELINVPTWPSFAERFKGVHGFEAEADTSCRSCHVAGPRTRPITDARARRDSLLAQLHPLPADEAAPRQDIISQLIALDGDVSARLEVGDVVSVQILGLMSEGRMYSRTAAVDGTGLIHVPRIGEIQAAGRTVREVREDISTTLKGVFPVPASLMLGGPVVDVVHDPLRAVPGC